MAGPAIRSGEESPLAASVMRVLNLKEQRPSIEQFFRWAAFIRRDTPSGHLPQSPIKDIGCVRSVHLFRERKMPLHHEFALVSFVNRLGQYSWVRLERAARIKHRWLQADSFGPILAGAALRETVTFGVWEEQLLSIDSPADEVAAVRMNETLPSEPLHELFIDDFVEHLQTISKAKPEYQLFSANCRWFARRIVLSVAQRLQSFGSPAKYGFMWKSGPATYNRLFDKIQRDPFGGKQLEKSEGQIIKAQSLVRLAANQRDDSRYSEALASCDEGLWVLHAMSTDSISRQTTLIRAFSERYRIKRDMGSHDDALFAIRQACAIIRVVCKDEHHAGDLAVLLRNALFNLSQATRQSEESQAKIQGALEAYEIWEELYHFNPSLHRESFVSALFTISEAYEGAGNEAEAIRYSHQAVRIRRKACLDSGRVDFLPLNVALNEHAEILNRLGRTAAAYECMKERVLLQRTTLRAFVPLPIPTGAPSTYNTSRRKGILSGLGDALIDQGKFALGLSLWEEAHLASKESLTIFDDLRASQPEVLGSSPPLYAQSLNDALTSNAWALFGRATGGVEIGSPTELLHEGIKVALRAMSLGRENYKQRPTPFRFYGRVTVLGILAGCIASMDVECMVTEVVRLTERSVGEAMVEWRELRALESNIDEDAHPQYPHSPWTLSRAARDILSYETGCKKRNGSLQCSASIPIPKANIQSH
ncbi:uncharacterized protein EI90DRAFT_3017837 [Cantharellus anzutake]|uniref:uncharacterized protein n=1 Tax=Cantharellus anzutake TaxID=1750568 RepID=UPI001905917A|nr:uncharacterized protein EI90DRAFT_3017837 [Cantharellus anzutake]KAF8328200.1 hypothetical protein EI90DRAFT_3017837 [Cantharellus anzutake]